MQNRIPIKAVGTHGIERRLKPEYLLGFFVVLAHPFPKLRGELLKKTYVFGNVTPVCPWYLPPRSA